MSNSPWYLNNQSQIPNNFLQQVQAKTNHKNCQYLAQLLWNRGIRKPQQLDFLLAVNKYQPSSYLAWGEEIKLAIQRLEQARNNYEKIAIWGDWKVDSLMATCILVEGLQQFFASQNQIDYYFPDRCYAHFGLNSQGIDKLAQKGISLIITASNGSHNEGQINYAHNLGIDIIIIDRPVVNPQRPSVSAWLNPQTLPDTHPFYHFSEVAIAYKLLEGLATEFPAQFPQGVTHLLDLVALGLLTENANLQGEGRYLAKAGIEIIKQNQRQSISFLARNCIEIGDRVLEQSHGLTNRLWAISCLYTDAKSVINLFTSNQIGTRTKLSDRAEKAYFNYLDLLHKILQEARQKLCHLDLSTTNLIILEDSQWHLDILNVATKIISQEYGKTTLLLTTNNSDLAQGYLYPHPDLNWRNLMLNCDHLLVKYVINNGQIYLQLPIEDIALFQEIIEQKIKSNFQEQALTSRLNIDLIITVAEVRESLYQQLKILEPFSADNPVPRLLIQNCRLSKIITTNFKNKKKGKETRYKKVTLEIDDQSSSVPVKGVIWGQSTNDLNLNYSYDLVGEIDYNTKEQIHYLRIIDYKISHPHNYELAVPHLSTNILDYRRQNQQTNLNKSDNNIIARCPLQWQEIINPYQDAIAKKQQLVLAYQENQNSEIDNLWLKFIGIIKYLIVNNKTVKIVTLLDKLNISRQSLVQILALLPSLEIEFNIEEEYIFLTQIKAEFTPENYAQAQVKFSEIIKQENFSKQYFYQVPINYIKRELE